MAPRIDYPSPGEFINYIVEYRDDHGVPPSVRDIAAHYEISTTAAQGLVRRMVDEGYIVRSTIARAVIVTERGAVVAEEARA